MSEAETGAGHAAAAVSMARERYLDDRHAYGCAETVFTVLKSDYGLPDAADPSVASALNGGIAYSGGTCGALTGAALASGFLAEWPSGSRSASVWMASRIADAGVNVREGAPPQGRGSFGLLRSGPRRWGYQVQVPFSSHSASVLAASLRASSASESRMTGSPVEPSSLKGV